ncbi:MAG TPA: response regulator [Candidatus Sulfotelmatobacter sp.]|nr:response regulator [Candidatus Sulfotelmatobacter sp.]
MGLDRLTILVVEDNGFARNMIAEILRAMKVGRVVTAADGADAIGMLRQAAKHKTAAQVLGFDIILSDYLMSPINGTMLLRWSRQHDDSPDRFIPFIMISGVADSEVVREARDMGTTEFLAKPFSVKSVADHISALIDTPRPFIYCSAYFGPDRRRQKRPPREGERRVIKPEEQEVVYSTSKLKKPDPRIKTFVFNLPNRLREKVMGLGKGGPMTIDPELLKAAEQQLDRMEGDYSDWVRGTVKQLSDAYDKAMADDRARVAMVAQINRISHDLRGQGTTFGYPLITVFGNSLFDCTVKIEKVSDKLLEFVRAHIDGITAVIRERIKGSGGAIGAELVESLERTRERLANTVE